MFGEQQLSSNQTNGCCLPEVREKGPGRCFLVESFNLNNQEEKRTK